MSKYMKMTAARRLALVAFSGAALISASAVAVAAASPNLVSNPGAEAGDLTGWTGSGWTTTGASPLAGSYSFVPTGNFASMHQWLVVAPYAAAIAEGTATMQLGGTGSVGLGSEVAWPAICQLSFVVAFYDAGDQSISLDAVSISSGSTTAQRTLAIPSNTASIKFFIIGNNDTDVTSGISGSVTGCAFVADDVFATIEGPGIPASGAGPLTMRLALGAALFVVAGGFALALGRRRVQPTLP